MTRLTFHVGLGSTIDPCKLLQARTELSTLFGGDTVTLGFGDWPGPNGLESENSATFLVYTDNPSLQSQAAEYLRSLYNQWEVWSIAEPVTVLVTSGVPKAA